MRAYISISFSKRQLLDKELNAIVQALTDRNIAPFVFVDRYRFNLAEERAMMQQAMRDIDKCELLIAETSDKGIGIGIEAGYAKAKGKTVLYLRHKDAEHSTTLSGISDFQVVYTDTADLGRQLAETLEKIITTK